MIDDDGDDDTDHDDYFWWQFVVGLFVLETEGYLATNKCNVDDKDFDDDYYYHYDDDDYDDDDDVGICSICLRTERHLAFLKFYSL